MLFQQQMNEMEKTWAAGVRGENHDIKCQQSAVVNHAEALSSQGSALTSSQ